MKESPPLSTKNESISDDTLRRMQTEVRIMCVYCVQWGILPGVNWISA